MFGVVGSYFRDVLRPISALPGAQNLHYMRVLSSGAMFHDIVTGMVSAAELMVSAPNRNEKEVSSKTWVEGLEQLLPQHYDDSNLPVRSALDAGMEEFKLLGMTFVPYRSLEGRYYAKFQRPFLITGSRVLIPTLEPARLVSLCIFACIKPSVED
jgi:hypothetical protein